MRSIERSEPVSRMCTTTWLPAVPSTRRSRAVGVDRQPAAGRNAEGPVEPFLGRLGGE